MQTACCSAQLAYAFPIKALDVAAELDAYCKEPTRCESAEINRDRAVERKREGWRGGREGQGGKEKEKERENDTENEKENERKKQRKLEVE